MFVTCEVVVLHVKQWCYAVTCQAVTCEVVLPLEIKLASCFCWYSDMSIRMNPCRMQ